MSFPATHLSLLSRIRSCDVVTRTIARDTLAAVYWAPIYTHVRLTHRLQPADAEDVTQGFFLEAMRRDLFARYEPARARFRTFLRTCVDSFVANTIQAGQRLKRGGGTATLSLEAAELEERLTIEATRTTADPDEVFHREWVRAIMLAALAKVRTRYEVAGRSVHLELFQCYDLVGADGEPRPTYAELARRFSIPITQVTNWLAAVRRDVRAAVLETMRELSTNDEELREDVRSLLGLDLT